MSQLKNLELSDKFDLKHCEGGVFMVSSREHGEHDPILRHQLLQDNIYVHIYAYHLFLVNITCP